MTAMAYEIWSGGHRERCLRMKGHGRGRGRGRRMSEAAGYGFLGRGPRAGRGDIRAAIIRLLSEQPMHGYQIMKELEERSGGVWRPSPGSIYPTLQQLQDEGLVRSDESDGRRIFTLTDEGRSAAEAQDQPTAPWEDVSESGDTAAISVRDMVGQVIVAARQVVRAGDEQQIAKATEVLNEARRKIYRILAEEPGDSTPEEH
jgi:DNA-binding PadR family transcriptional regulator